MSYLHGFKNDADPDADVRVLPEQEHGALVKTLELVRRDELPHLARSFTASHLVHSHRFGQILRQKLMINNVLGLAVRFQQLLGCAFGVLLGLLTKRRQVILDLLCGSKIDSDDIVRLY
jgi:hypothetical protein